MVNKLIKFECARAHMMRLEEHGTTGFYVKVREVTLTLILMKLSLEHDVGLYLVT